MLSDPDNRSEVVDTQQSGWIEYAFDAPFTLRSVRVHTPSPPGYAPGVYRAANSLEVQASDDGVTFRRIGALEYPRHGWQTDLTTLTHAVPQTTARYFRLVHTQSPPQPYGKETRQSYVFPMLRLGKPWLPDKGLLPAGLLGPVRLRCASVVPLD